MWSELATLEISNQWLWTSVTQANKIRLEFNSSEEFYVEVAQGDGSTIYGLPLVVATGQTQILNFPAGSDEGWHFAVRTGDRRLVRNYPPEWEVTISVSDTVSTPSDLSSMLQLLQIKQQEILEAIETTPTSTIDPAISTNIQSLAAGQTQILERLQQPIQAQISPEIAFTLQELQSQQSGILQILQNPIQAQIDPALANNIQMVITAQAEILALVQEASPTDPAIASSLDNLLAGQNQILQQFPVAVAPDSLLRDRVQTILSLLQPPPIAALVLIPKPFAVSQSSIYGNFSFLTGSYANLTDGNAGTGAATSSNPLEWIQATFDTPIECAAIQVGGGSLPNWGGVAAYLNNRQLQYSVNGSDWGTLAQIVRVEDSGSNQFVLTAFPRVTARFFRIASNSWLSTTEFKFFN